MSTFVLLRSLLDYQSLDRAALTNVVGVVAKNFALTTTLFVADGAGAAVAQSVPPLLGRGALACICWRGWRRCRRCRLRCGRWLSCGLYVGLGRFNLSAWRSNRNQSLRSF